MTLKISIIMIDGSFRERFHSISSLMEQTLPKSEYEVLWIEYIQAKNPDLLSLQKQYSATLKIINLNKSSPYHASYCFNAGISAAKAELIAIVDADLIFEPNFLESVCQDHQANPALAEYFYRINEPRASFEPFVRLDHLKKCGILTDPFNSGAALTVRKKWLMEINGYDLHPIFEGGHHRNDLDIYSRLRTKGLAIRWHPQLKVFHSWHPGTEGEPIGHKVHKVLSFYRSQNLIVYPFMGINPIYNNSLSQEIKACIPFALNNLEQSEKEQIEKTIDRYFYDAL